MRNLPGFLTFVAAFTITACHPDPVVPADVVTVEVCPPDVITEGGCTPSPVADGRPSAVARICTPLEKDRKTDLKGTLTLSSGQWATPSDPALPSVTTVSLGAERCATATFVTPKTPGYIRIDAEIGGISVPKWYAVPSAPVGSIVLRPSVGSLTPGEANTVQLAVEAKSPLGGSLSAGTLARVTVATGSIKPAGAFATIVPEQVLLDDKGAATVTISTGKTLTELSLNVVVTPPDAPGTTAPPPGDAGVRLSTP